MGLSGGMGLSAGIVPALSGRRRFESGHGRSTLRAQVGRLRQSCTPLARWAHRRANTSAQMQAAWALW
jgi:hypothetical protein